MYLLFRSVPPILRETTPVFYPDAIKKQDDVRAVRLNKHGNDFSESHIEPDGHIKKPEVV